MLNSIAANSGLEVLATRLFREIKVEYRLSAIGLYWKKTPEAVYSTILFHSNGTHQELAARQALDLHLAESLTGDETPQFFTQPELEGIANSKSSSRLPAMWFTANILVGTKQLGLLTVSSDEVLLQSNTDVFLDLLQFIGLQLSLAAHHVNKDAEVKTQTARLNAVFESSNHLIWTLDNQGELTSFNQRYYDTFIKNPDAKLFTLAKDGSWRHKEVHQLWTESISMLQLGEILTREVKVEENNRFSRFEIFLAPLEIHNSEVMEISGIGNDVTEREQDKTAIAKAKEELEISLAAKEQFLANMSHEIRTPLNGVIGMIDVMKHTNTTEEQKKYLDIIDNSSTSLLALLNDILDMSRLNAGRTDLSPSAFNPSLGLEQIVSLFSPIASENNIRLEHTLQRHLPSTVVGDRNKIHQILSNLISNALKFTESGGEVVVKLQKVSVDIGEALRYSVVDNGIGIANEDQEMIFESFTQVNSSSNKQFKGTGLGLAIAKELCQLLGGNLGLKSQLNNGSEFWFDVPLLLGEDELSHEDQSNPVAALPKRVLLVDDNQVNRLVGSKLLLDLGVKVTIASNGPEALDKLVGSAFDLILLDIQMPDMDGFTVLTRLKEMQIPHPKVIAVTAYSSDSEHDRFTKAGFDGFLPKPFRLDTLERALKGSDITLKPIAGEPMVLNDVVVKQLSRHCSKEEIAETYEDFLQESDAQITACQKLLANACYEDMLGQLHSMKGNAGTIGAEKIAKQAENIEYHLKNNNYKSLNRELDFLKLSFEEFKNCLKKVI